MIVSEEEPDRADILFGSTDNDLTQRLGGIDDIFGEDDKDRIEGGTEKDRLEGGTGNDTLTNALYEKQYNSSFIHCGK